MSFYVSFVAFKLFVYEEGGVLRKLIGMDTF